MRRTLDVDAAHAHRALIHSRLDYCQQCVGWTASIHVQATPVGECGGCSSFSYLAVSNSDGRETALARISTSSHVQVVTSWSTKVCMDCTRLLVQTMCSSSWSSWPCTSQVGFSWTAWCQLPRRTIGDKGFSHWWPCGMEPFLCICGATTAPQLDCFKKHLKTALFKLTTQK